MTTPPPIPDGFLRTWCDTLSEGSESPPGAFLPTGLAMLSAALGPRLIMRWSATAEERANLWILNVGMSALARKTSGLAGLKVAVKWARAEGRDTIRLMNVARVSDAGLVTSLDVVGPDTAAALAEEENLTPKGEKPRDIGEVVRPVPVAWLAVFNEVAPIWMDDGPGWVMDAQRTLLSIYDGDLVSNTRASKVPHQECFVTAVGNIPPGVLREHTSLGMLVSGWVGRWLVIPTPPPDRIVSFPMPNGADPLTGLRDQVEHLVTLGGRGTRHVINDKWTEDAKAVRHAWYEGHFSRYRDGNTDDVMLRAAAELWGRLQATAVKVATLHAAGRTFHQLDTLAELQVTDEDVVWACDLIDSSISYITASLEEAGADDSSTLGKVEGRVLRYLQRSGAQDDTSSRTIRNVVDAAKGGKASRSDVVRAVDGLLQAGLVTVTEDRRVWLAGGTWGNGGGGS